MQSRDAAATIQHCPLGEPKRSEMSPLLIAAPCAGTLTLDAARGEDHELPERRLDRHNDLLWLKGLCLVGAPRSNQLHASPCSHNTSLK